MKHKLEEIAFLKKYYNFTAVFGINQASFNFFA
jgi:hypothetical protein